MGKQGGQGSDSGNWEEGSRWLIKYWEEGKKSSGCSLEE